VDDIGPPVDLIGLCQGGWLSLVYAARFPGKVRRLVLAGAPIGRDGRAVPTLGAGEDDGRAKSEPWKNYHELSVVE
jgi:pimeloyl-ACP methyl ester carboxylesterase